MLNGKTLTAIDSDLFNTSVVFRSKVELRGIISDVLGGNGVRVPS